MRSEGAQDTESQRQLSSFSLDYDSHDTYGRLSEGALVAPSPIQPSESTTGSNVGATGVTAIPNAKKRSKMPVAFARNAGQATMPAAARARAGRSPLQAYGAPSLGSAVDADDEW